MQKRLLILSIYPAPYRYASALGVSEGYQADIFFEHSNGDYRNEDYFARGQYLVLENEAGRSRFRECVRNIRKYDAVILFDYPSKTGLCLAAKCIAARVPYVLNADGDILTPHGNFAREMVKRFFIKRASRCFAGCKSAENYFISRGADRRKVTLHPFSETKREDVLSSVLSQIEKERIRSKLFANSFSKVALGVGRFVDYKNYESLIVGWAKMPAEWLLVIVGGGPLGERYRDLVRDKKISNVSILEYVPHDELWEYYAAADLFLHPAVYEVYGLVINEAMSMGVPIIATDKCNAALELVDESDTGVLIKSGDDCAFIEAARSLLLDDKLRSSMSENCLRKMKKFTMEEMISRQKETVDSLLLADRK